MGLVVLVPASGGAAEDNPWLDRRVLVIAHAGGENEGPHSTLYAYEQAVANGAEVLEGDVRLTADGVLVVHHDATVDATTDGTGRVDEMTYDQLFALDHGYKYTPYQWSCGACPEEDYVFRGVRTGAEPPPDGHTPEDFTIPTARQLFEQFPDHFLDLEIKESGPVAQAAAEALIALIEEFDAQDRTIVVSFDEPTVEYVRQNLPGAITSPGVQGMTEWFLDPSARLSDPIIQIPPSFSGIEVLSAELVQRAHDEGVAVWVWMNGSEQENYEYYTELVELGVDGLLVSRPSVARQAVDDAGATWVPPEAPGDPDDDPSSDADVPLPAADPGGAVLPSSVSVPVPTSPAARPAVGAPAFTG